MKIIIERKDKNIELPRSIHEDDAGFDISSSEEITIKPKEKVIVKTGLKMIIPKGYVGLIWDRSGLAAKHSIHTLAGVIDSGYRGEVGIVMINLSEKEFKIEKNMRIAQMLIQKIEKPIFEEVNSINDETKRGEGGFGSSGK
jgi:dUTP pyrophosphatase